MIDFVYSFLVMTDIYSLVYCCTGLVNQLGEHHGLPLRTGFSTGRGFFIQMRLVGVTLPEGKLPPEFIKVSIISLSGKQQEHKHK